MEHLLEVLKIIRYGASGDKRLLYSYVEQLALKLDKDGEGEQAARWQRRLGWIFKREDRFSKMYLMFKEYSNESS